MADIFRDLGLGARILQRCCSAASYVYQYDHDIDQYSLIRLQY